MQVALYQSMPRELLVISLNVKGEIPESKFDLVKYLLEKEYPFFSNYKILKAYITEDNQIIVQLFEEKTQQYMAIRL